MLAYRNTAPISMLSENSLAAVQKVLPPGVEAADMGDNAAGADSSKRMVMGWEWAYCCCSACWFRLTAA